MHPPPSYSPLGRQSSCVFTAYRHIDPVGTPHVYGINEATASDIVVGVNTSVMHGGSMNLPDPSSCPSGRRVWFKDESDNAGTYGFSITTAGGTIEGGGGSVDVDGECIGYYSNGVDTWFQIDAVGGGSTITGSATQIPVCDGAGNAAGAADLTWDGSTFLANGTLSFNGDLASVGSTVNIAAGGGTIGIVVDAGGAAPVVTMGDAAGSFNASTFSVDDVNQKTTSNVKHETTGDITVLNSSKGIVLKDGAGTPHYWRVTINTSGVLVTTDLGTSPP